MIKHPPEEIKGRSEQAEGKKKKKKAVVLKKGQCKLLSLKNRKIKD